MDTHAYFITAIDLATAGPQQMPAELQSDKGLIYSSPATLSFNSPGAQGFGVKRAGLAVPGSVMLLVAPGCCGRNTSTLDEPAYRKRFFYLLQNETDIVTGKHLQQIPQAVQEVCQSLSEPPSVVMLCITCVDALLGTDMERICRKAEKLVGIPVRPCYMYALTRESRKPPMVAVRQAIYSLLQPAAKNPRAVNLLGYFSPLQDDTELYPLLRQLGIQISQEIARCQDFTQYQAMAQANFNLILHPEARLAAQDMESRLHIPSIELARLYQLDKVQKQYHIFAAALSSSLQDEPYYAEAQQMVTAFCSRYASRVQLAIGSMLNANPFELALAMLRYGLTVTEIYAAPVETDFIYLRKIAALSPTTKIYTNLSPTMLYYDCSDSSVTLTLGKDAAYYHPHCPNVAWNQERQPFGYAGIKSLFQQMRQALKEEENL